MQVAKKDPLVIIEEIVARHKNSIGAAIPILQEIQTTLGHVSVEYLKKVSSLTQIPASELYGIVTFYSQFRLDPLGEHHIQICDGTACHLAGSDQITEVFESETKTTCGCTSSDGKYTLEKVACIGCCSMGPVANIDGKIVGRLTADKVKKIVKELNSTKGNGDN